MKPNTADRSTCVLCDFWWVLLILAILVVVAIVTRDYWMFRVGLV